MNLVPAKCPSCGGLIEVDKDRKAANCQHCKEAFIVEEAIQTYNTYFQTINNIGHVENMIYNDEKSIENRIKNAVNNLYVIENREEAYKNFKSIAEDDSSCWKAWLGIAVCEAKLALEQHKSGKLTSYSNQAVVNAVKTSPEGIRNELWSILDKTNSVKDDVTKLNSARTRLKNKDESVKKKQAAVSRWDSIVSGGLIKYTLTRLMPSEIIIFILVSIVVCGLWGAFFITCFNSDNEFKYLLIGAIPLIISVAIATGYIVFNKSDYEHDKANLYSAKNDYEKTTQQIRTDEKTVQETVLSISQNKGLLTLDKLPKDMFD